MWFFFLMRRRPPRSTRTDTLFPYTTLFRSEVALVAGRVVVVTGDVHVARLALVDHLRRGQRRAPLPALDDAWIAGGGHRAFAEVAEHEQRVAVDPADRKSTRLNSSQ